MRKAFGAILAFVSLAAGVFEQVDAQCGCQEEETVFVFEMIRHGARSHYENNVDSYQFFGVGQGHITHLGRQETS